MESLIFDGVENDVSIAVLEMLCMMGVRQDLCIGDVYEQ